MPTRPARDHCPRLLLLGLLLLAALAGQQACGGEPAAENATEPAAPPDMLLRVTVGGKFGYVDHDGNLLAAAVFDQTHEAFAERRCGVKQGERWGFVDTTGKLAVKPLFLEVGPYAGGLAAVRTEQGWGYVDPNGKLVVKPQYARATRFAAGLARVAVAAGADDTGASLLKWGLIKPDGRWLLKPRWAAIDPFADGLAAINEGGKWGFGRLIGGTWGYLDLAGKVVCAPRFERAEPFAEGLAAVRQQGRWGYLDRQGKLVVEPVFQSAAPFAGGLAIVRDAERRMGVVDRQGHFVVQPRYDSISDFRDGLAVTVLELRSGLIRADGTVLLETEHAAVQLLGERRVGLQSAAGGRWALLDDQGKPLTEPVFTALEPFEDQARARVYVGGAHDPIVGGFGGGFWGYIDPTGELVVEAKYLHAWPFRNGVAGVRSPNEWRVRLIDPAGQVVANEAFGTGRHVAQYTAVGVPVTPTLFQVSTTHQPPQIGYWCLQRRHWIWKLQN